MESRIPIERHGNKIIVPELPSDLKEIAKVILQADELDNQLIKVSSTFNAALWDGAKALHRAMKEELGVVLPIVKETMMGPQQPQEIEVEVALDKVERIAWGDFELAGMEGGKVSTGFSGDPALGQFVFQVTATIRRKFEARIRAVFSKAKQYAETEPLHRGKAFMIQFTDADGDPIPLPMPKFFRIQQTPPVFRRKLELAIERNIFTPIRYSSQVEWMGESLKRGVLFAGEYGMGKTLLASYIAREAVENGWTFIYVRNSHELPLALRFAQRYQPVVIFAEDLDRVAGADRTDKVNALLNQLDGVDSKHPKILTVLTTNHPEDVNPAMRRPGRIDLILHVLPPDEEAVARLVQQYAGENLAEDADLSGIASVLAGMAPAYVREAVSRAKLETLRRTASVTERISGEDLRLVAEEVRDENHLFRRPKKEEKEGIERFGSALVEAGSHMLTVATGDGEIRVQ